MIGDGIKSGAKCQLFANGEAGKVEKNGAKTVGGGWLGGGFLLQFHFENFARWEKRMGARRIRRDQRRYDMMVSRIENGSRKEKERSRRDARVKDMMSKSTSFPYSPVIMSWLSAKLDKPSTQITAEEAKAVLAEK
jgi:hypothetical protein